MTGEAGETRETDDETPGRIDIAIAVPLRGRQVLVAQRAQDAHLGGSWEFPGGKVEPGEAPSVAALREMGEETGLTGGVFEPLVVVVHDYAEAPLRFHVFLVREPSGTVRMDGPRPYAWVDVDALAGIEMPEANRQMVKALRWRLGAGAGG